jgi:microcin C transport system substrate-binding protein
MKGRTAMFWINGLAALLLVAFVTGMAAPARSQVPEAQPSETPRRHGFAMHGEPKYGPDFAHFDYVNPDAPKGGSFTQSALGTFDNLNPFTIRGVTAPGTGLIYDTLMTSSADEEFTQYGLVAESIEVPEDRSWAAFDLRPEARFHDGHPITPDDVIFTFGLLTEMNPMYRAYWGNVAKVEKTGEHRVLFRFKPGDNRELPLILGQMLVLPKHYWESRDPSRTTLDPPLGSGPYRIATLDPGRSITYEQVADYWGRDLPVNRGRNNFGRMRFEFYRDAAVALEAFKAGLYDFRLENTAKVWATGYDFPALREGRVTKEELPNQLPTGMQGFVFNTRRPIFDDPKVREAIAQAFHFEWINDTLFYGAYKRTGSYFENSPLAAKGLPSPDELKILEPLRGSIPDAVFDREYSPPRAKEPGDFRENLLKAQAMLDEAGWILRDNIRVHRDRGIPLQFEILLDSPAFERIVLPFVGALRRLGIIAQIRTVDTAQYQNRLQTFDFDMIVNVWGQSLSPGNEQRNFWSSDAADRPGSDNYPGISNPAIDRLIELVIAAPSRDDLLTRVHALDRVLLWGHYVVPHWHSGTYRVVYWNRITRPAVLPPYGLTLDTWWAADTAGARTEAESGAGAAATARH